MNFQNAHATSNNALSVTRSILEMLTLTSYKPADTLLSQINKGHGPEGSMAHRLIVLARQAGFHGLFAGLGPRMVMTAGLVAGQFLLYGVMKDGQSLIAVQALLHILTPPIQHWARRLGWRSTRRVRVAARLSARRFLHRKCEAMISSLPHGAHMAAEVVQWIPYLW